MAGESMFICESDSITALEGVLAPVPTWSSKSWSSASIIGVAPPVSMMILSSLMIMSLLSSVSSWSPLSLGGGSVCTAGTGSRSSSCSDGGGGWGCLLHPSFRCRVDLPPPGPVDWLLWGLLTLALGQNSPLKSWILHPQTHSP